MSHSVTQQAFNSCFEVRPENRRNCRASRRPGRLRNVGELIRIQQGPFPFSLHKLDVHPVLVPAFGSRKSRHDFYLPAFEPHLCRGQCVWRRTAYRTLVISAPYSSATTTCYISGPQSRPRSVPNLVVPHSIVDTYEGASTLPCTCISRPGTDADHAPTHRG